MTSKPAIIAKNVSVTYRGGVTALENANLSVNHGSICGLVGINGAGKSTLFKSLLGLVPLSAGEVTLMGHSVKQALAQNLVAYVPQNEDVDWTFPVLVRDVVMMGRYGTMGFLRRAKKHDHAAVKSALARVNMEEFADRQIGELSGGQKKRVFLARALAQEAKIILLDEPFTGVDVGTEEAIVTLMRELRDAGHVMLVSTHNLGSVPEFCDHVAFINRTVLAEGPTEQVFTQKNLKLAFGSTLRHHVLEGTDLHDDDDPRKLIVLTDDERPVVIYGEGDE